MFFYLQAEVHKLVSALRIKLGPKPLKLKHKEGYRGGLTSLRNTVTGLIVHERLEMKTNLGNLTRYKQLKITFDKFCLQLDRILVAFHIFTCAGSILSGWFLMLYCMVTNMSRRWKLHPGNLVLILITNICLYPKGSKTIIDKWHGLQWVMVKGNGWK